MGDDNNISTEGIIEERRKKLELLREENRAYLNNFSKNEDCYFFSLNQESRLKDQMPVHELVKKYKPAVLWFDGEWIPEWTEKQGKDLYKYLMELDPKLIINNRISKAREGMSGMNKYDDAAGDFGTPEQEILEETSDYDWESCMTMNDTRG